MINAFISPKLTKMTSMALGVAVILAVGAVLQLLWGAYARGRTPSVGGGRVVAAPVTAQALPPPVVFLKTTTQPDRGVSNLFHSTYIERTLLKLEEQRKLRLAAEKEARAKVVKEAVRVAAVVPPPKVLPVVLTKTNPPPPQVRFCFQGLIQTADGQTLALINSSPAGRSAPVAEGEKCHGVVVTNLSAESVDLVLGDGSLRGIAKGKPEIILEAKLYGH